MSCPACKQQFQHNLLIAASASVFHIVIAGVNLPSYSLIMTAPALQPAIADRTAFCMPDSRSALVTRLADPTTVSPFKNTASVFVPPTSTPNLSIVSIEGRCTAASRARVRLALACLAGLPLEPCPCVVGCAQMPSHEHWFRSVKPL